METEGSEFCCCFYFLTEAIWNHRRFGWRMSKKAFGLLFANWVLQSPRVPQGCSGATPMLLHFLYLCSCHIHLSIGCQTSDLTIALRFKMLKLRFREINGFVGSHTVCGAWFEVGLQYRASGCLKSIIRHPCHLPKIRINVTHRAFTADSECEIQRCGPFEMSFLASFSPVVKSLGKYFFSFFWLEF